MPNRPAIYNCSTCKGCCCPVTATRRSPHSPAPSRSSSPSRSRPAFAVLFVESVWDADTVNTRRLELLRGDPETAPHGEGVLVIDETGDRKDGTKTAHVAHQYLGSIGRIANGIVSVSSVWADERVYYPLHIEPYEPASRLPRGKKDPRFPHQTTDGGEAGRAGFGR